MGICCSSPSITEPPSDEAQAAFDAYFAAATRLRSSGNVPESLDVVVKNTLFAAAESAVQRGRRGLELRFEDTDLGSHGALAMAELVSMRFRVKSLAIVRSGLTHLAASELGRNLRCANALVALDVSENPINEAGIRGLLRYIGTNNSLTSLNLRKTGMNEEGASLITNKILLSSSCSIRYLDVSDNGLHDRCLEGFARAIPSHFRILSMKIGGNGGQAPALPPVRRIRNSSSDDESDVVASADQDSGSSEPRYLSLAECEGRINAVLQRNAIVASAIDFIVSRSVDKVLSINGTSAAGAAATAAPLGSPGSEVNLDMAPMSPASTKEGSATNTKLDNATDTKLDNSVVAFGFADARGRRKRMEDVVMVNQQFRNKAQEHLFGVFDGHGGIECAKFVHACFGECLQNELLAAAEPGVEGDERDSLPSSGPQPIAPESSDWSPSSHGVAAELVKDSDPIEDALVRAFERMQRFCEMFKIQNGSCALVAYFSGSRVFVSTVGDSRALLVPRRTSGRKAEWLSQVITPALPEERARIEYMGGFVTANGRVCGVLAVSRAIGDIQYARIISAKPTVMSHDITAEDQWLVLGCDGVWDVLTPEIVSNLLAYVKDPIRAAQIVRDSAFSAGSRDNLSVICVQLCS